MSRTISRRAIVRGTAWATPAVAVAVAAPAFAASSTSRYRFRASQYYRRVCSTTRYLTASNQVQVGTSPLGFTVVNDVGLDGKVSPTTTATIQSLTFVVGFPESWLDSSAYANPFTMLNGTGANWTLASATRTRMVNTDYRVYTFTFTGPTTASTVSDGTSPGAWPNSAFQANLKYSTKLCTGSYQVWGGYEATITTANGQTVTSTLPPRWNDLHS